MYITPVVGYRAFRMYPAMHILSSCLMHYRWRPHRPQVAVCQQGNVTEEVARGLTDRHLPPDPDCMCGFYAYNELSELQRYTKLAPDICFGLIIGYGTIIPADKGWRAGKVEIVALISGALNEPENYGRLRMIPDYRGEREMRERLHKEDVTRMANIYGLNIVAPEYADEVARRWGVPSGEYIDDGFSH